MYWDKTVTVSNVKCIQYDVKHNLESCVWRHIVYTLHLIYSTHNGDDAPQKNSSCLPREA